MNELSGLHGSERYEARDDAKQDKGEWVRGPTLHPQTPAVRAFSADAAVGQKAGLYYIFRLSLLKMPMKSGFFSGSR